MKRYLLALLLLVTSLHAQNGQVTYASDFAQWQLPQGTGAAAGAINYPSPEICRVSSQGRNFVGPKVGRPLKIVDTVIPTQTEYSTPTQVTLNNNTCNVTLPTTYTHLNYQVVSGTAGLQEAIDYNETTGAGSVVVITPAWTLAGGTTGMITAARGNSSVSIIDERTACFVPYQWNGSTFAAGPSFCQNGIASNPSPPNFSMQFNNNNIFGGTVPTYNPTLSAFSNLQQHVMNGAYGDTPTLPGANNFSPEMANAYFSNVYATPLNQDKPYNAIGIYTNALRLAMNQNQNGYQFKPGVQPMSIITESHGEGSTNLLNLNNYQEGVGDAFNIFSTLNCWGGTTAGGDEGCESADHWIFQGNVEFTGTASGSGTGLTSLLTSPTAGSRTQGAGRWLIDLTQATSTGSVTAISSFGTSYSTYTGSGTGWPVSTVNTTLGTAVNPPGIVTVTPGSMSGITTSTVLCIADAGNFETLIPSATTGTTFTALFLKAFSSSAIVSAGGLCGYYIGMHIDTVSSGGPINTLHYILPIIRSTSPTSIDVWTAYAGHWAQYEGAAPSTDGAYAIYPGAEVLDVSNGGTDVSNTFTLMPNTMTVANGDNMAEPLYPYLSMQEGNTQVFRYLPGGNAFLREYIFGGYVNHGALFYIVNNTPSAWYNSAIGRNPPQGVWFNGSWANGVKMGNPPTESALVVGCPVAPCAAYNLIENSTTGVGTDTFSYNEAGNGEWDLTTGGNHQHTVKFLPDSSVISQSELVSLYGMMGNAQNDLLYSQFPSSSIGSTWVSQGTNALASQTSNNATDPNGNMTAETVVAPTLTSVESSGQAQTVSVTSGTFYTITFCFRGHAGGEFVEFGIVGDTNNENTATLTTSMLCYYTIPVAAVSSSSIKAYWAFVGTASSGATADVAFAQLENTNFHGQYLPTTSVPALVSGTITTNMYVSALANAAFVTTDGTGHLLPRDLSAPPPIGGATPNTGAFTTLTASSGLFGGTPKLGVNTTSNNDITGRITLSAGTGSYAFANTYTNAVNCICKDETTLGNLTSCSTTNTTLSVTASGATDSITYICVSRQ